MQLDCEESVYSKKLSDLVSVIRPLLHALSERTLQSNSLLLLTHFQTALFHYLERNFVSKIEAAAASAVAMAGITTPTATATTNTTAATTTATDAKRPASAAAATTASSNTATVSTGTATASALQMALNAALAAAPTAAQLFRPAFVNAVSSTVQTYSVLVLEAISKRMKTMLGHAYPV
jgi:hypothetical protein